MNVALVFLVLTLNIFKIFFRVSIADFEDVFVYWVLLEKSRENVYSKDYCSLKNYFTTSFSVILVSNRKLVCLLWKPLEVPSLSLKISLYRGCFFLIFRNVSQELFNGTVIVA